MNNDETSPKSINGNFEYTATGFILRVGDQSYRIGWTEIEKLIVYKIELITFDEIYLDIVLSETIITITEEISGWWYFMDQVELQFPTSKDLWDKFWGGPAFDRIATKIYHRSK